MPNIVAFVVPTHTSQDQQRVLDTIVGWSISSSDKLQPIARYGYMFCLNYFAFTYPCSYSNSILACIG